MSDTITNALTEAVEAWCVAQGNANEFTSLDLGVAVHRYAEAAGLDAAEAMKRVRAAGQTAQSLTTMMETPAPAAKPEPVAETPEQRREAAWNTLVQAFRATEAESTEATEGALASAAFRYAAEAGLTPSAARDKVRVAVRSHGPKREIYVGYMHSEKNQMGGMTVTTTWRLVEFADVLSFQEELRRLPGNENLIILSWSAYDAR